MKVFTLGSGFIAEHLPYQKIGERISFSEFHLKTILDDYKPDVLINCIGKTGRPNVDWCESNKEATAISNVALPILLADYCAQHKIHLIQIGSGCVYFGRSPNTDVDVMGYHNDYTISIDTGWKETDFANPQSFYSKSKYSCDLILGSLPHVTTLRIRMPVSEQDTPRNTINKLRGYSHIIDIPNSMTFMSDLTRCVDWAVTNRPGGIFHVTNPEALTAARIMKEYQKYVPEHTFEIIDERQLDAITTAKRSNCILSSKKLNDYGFYMTDSEEALEHCMIEYIQNIRKNNVKL